MRKKKRTQAQIDGAKRAAEKRAVKRAEQLAEESKSEVETNEKKPARTERVPFGSPSQKMARPAKPGKVRRWFNDEGNRIALAEQSGRTFVRDENNEKEVMVVGTNQDGSEKRAYLMEIDEDLYQEDQVLKQGAIDAIDEAIKEGVKDPVENAYLPDKRKSAVSISSKRDP